VVPATAGLSDLTNLSSSGSIAYAVSTAPGVVAAGNEPAQQLYRTADGLSWTTATGPTGVSADGVAVDGNRVYTVGTGPATAATGDSGAWTTAVSWTDNGGGSWQNSVLPVDLNAPAGTVTVNDEAVNVAAGPKGVVAAVSISATAELSKLVPGVSAKTLWTANTNGVEVLGSQVSSQCGVSVAYTPTGTLQQSSAAKKSGTFQPSVAIKLKLSAEQRAMAATLGNTPAAPGGQLTTVPCAGADGQTSSSVRADQAYRVVKAYTWSQLNISGQLAQVLQSQPLVFSSSDGTNFRQVSLPAGTAGQAYVTGTPGGFAIVELPGVGGPPVVLQSAGGQHWTLAPFGLPAGVTGVSGIGYVGGHLVVVGQTQTGSAAYTLLSDEWQTTALQGNVMAVSFGPLGVGVAEVSGSGAPGTWQVQFSRDGLQWSSTASLSSLTGGAVDDANVVVGATSVVVTITRPPTAQPPTGPSDQVQVVGTPAR
jgi:hypothetical protein